jgi:hypothetical protein
MEPVVGVLYLDDGAVDELADRDRDPGEGHDVDRDAEQVERDERQQNEIGIVTIGTIADGSARGRAG